MSEWLKIPQTRVVGARQTLRALAEGKVRTAYIAEDASPAIRRQLEEAASAANVPTVTNLTMEALGKVCRVDVPSAAAGILKDTSGVFGEAKDTVL